MIGEFALIERLSSRLQGDGPGVPVGFGDDAAVIDGLRGAAVLTTDALVAGRHWLPGLSTPADVGWKAVAVNVSDLAAMGARPLAAVVALHWPADHDPASAGELYDGMAEAAAEWDVALVGGDVVDADQIAVSVAMLGDVEAGAAVRRRGARPGDRLVCVGALGAAGAGLAQALGDPVEGPADPARADPARADPALLAAHRRPRALPAAGSVLAAEGAHAMIDVSDGLGADLGHLCRASGVGARVRAAALPVAAGVAEAAADGDLDVLDLVCGGGEDFALLAALPADRAEAVAAAAAAPEGVPGAVVGTFVDSVAGEPLARLEVDGGPDRALSSLGYQHYRGSRGAGSA